MPLHFPQFGEATPSAQYQEISNFCVAYTEGLLIDAMHLQMEHLEPSEQLKFHKLQVKLQQRERTLRHAFQFQIEKLFSDFKMIRRTRLHANRAGDWLALGLAGHASSIVQASIDNTSELFAHRHDRSLRNLVKRLQTLVHRSDDAHDDNPVGPRQLCNAFIASIEALQLTGKQTCQLMEIFHQVLEQSLHEFYRQLDLGLFYLNVLPELTDPQLLNPAEPELEAEAESHVEPEAEAFTKTETEAQAPAEAAPPVDLKLDQQSVSGKDVALELEQADHVEVSVEKDQQPVIAEPAKQQTSTAKAETSLETSSELPEAEASSIAPTTSSLDTKKQVKQQQDDRQINRLLKSLRQSTAAGAAHYAVEFNRFRGELATMSANARHTALDNFLQHYTHLLENPRLSVAVRIQLSRLAEPLLLQTLDDPGFFEDDNHPARTLVLAIIDFDISHGHNISISGFIATVFDELLLTKRPSREDFTATLDSFSLYQKDELQKIHDEAAAQAQRRQELAAMTLETINDMTATLVVEQQVLAFFYDDWQLILLHLADKAGADSDAYQESVKIGRELAWLIDENRQANETYENTSFSNILKAIEMGLQSLDYSSEHRSRVRKLLIAAFHQAQSNQAHISVKPAPATTDESDNFIQFNETIRSHTQTLAKLRHHLTSTDDAELAHFIDSLQLGSWVEIQESGGKRFRRGKLKWKAPDNSRFIFIDQRGHKINESLLEDIKLKFEDEKIRLLSTPKQQGFRGPRLGHGFHF